MVAADHCLEFDVNMFYSPDLEEYNTGMLKAQSLTVYSRWGYRQVRQISTKSCLTVQKPSGFSTFHFILLIFHIQASAMLWPNVFARVAGI